MSTKRISIRPERVKISKPGFDVGTTNPDELIWSSDWVAARVRAWGAFTGGSPQTIFYPKTYRTRPLVLCGLASYTPGSSPVRRDFRMMDIIENRDGDRMTTTIYRDRFIALTDTWVASNFNRGAYYTVVELGGD